MTDFVSGKRMMSFRMHTEEGGVIANAVGAGFSGQATPNPNPYLAGKDITLGSKKSRLLKRKTPNV